MGRTPANNNRLDTKVVVSLKNLSNFWKSLGSTLINCKTELDLSWSKSCIISEISRTAAVTANSNSNPSVLTAAATEKNNVTFQINTAKRYVPVVTFCL